MRGRAGAVSRVVLEPTIEALGFGGSLDGAAPAWEAPQTSFWGWVTFVAIVVGAFGTAYCRNNTTRWGC